MCTRVKGQETLAHCLQPNAGTVCSYPPLQNDWDRPAVPVTAAARAHAGKQQKTPEKDFSTKRVQPSFDQATVASLTSKNPDFPTLTPQGHRQSGVRWEYALKHKGVWANMEDTWRNTLVLPGTLLHKPDSEPILLFFSRAATDSWQHPLCRGASGLRWNSAFVQK